jgi:hypothetical protein
VQWLPQGHLLRTYILLTLDALLNPYNSIQDFDDVKLAELRDKAHRWHQINLRNHLKGRPTGHLMDKDNLEIYLKEFFRLMLEFPKRQVWQK